jgi:hypothetical protein
MTGEQCPYCGGPWPPATGSDCMSGHRIINANNLAQVVALTQIAEEHCGGDREAANVWLDEQRANGVDLTSLVPPEHMEAARRAVGQDLLRIGYEPVREVSGHPSALWTGDPGPPTRPVPKNYHWWPRSP